MASGPRRSQNAHDIAEGGLAVALAECCIAGGIGARCGCPRGSIRSARRPGTAFIVSGRRRRWRGSPCIGRVGGDRLEIEGLLDLAVSELRDARASGLAEWI